MMTTIPIALTILLIALLIKREFLHGIDGPRSRKLLRGLNVLIVPLLVVFLVMVGFQLRSGQSSEIAEIASASSANNSVTSSFDNIPSLAAATTPALANDAPTSSTAVPAAIETPALSPVSVLQQVAAAEKALHSGQIDATVEYPKGTRSSTRLIFDLDTTTGMPNLHMTTLYTSTVGTNTYERIIIGNKTWERSPNGKWLAMATSQSVAEQVQIFLPGTASVQNASASSIAQAPVLQWSTTDKASTNTLNVLPNDGIPQRLQRVTGASGEKLTVTYSNWNAPVTITPPTQSK